jgi:GNAT superfamily N-acetyltransferase
MAERIMNSEFGPGSHEHESLSRIEVIRGISDSDLLQILHWVDDPETARHLEPVPYVPEDWNDEAQVERATQELRNYYRNVGVDGVAEPQKIMPFVGANNNGEILSVATMRWKGDPFVSEIGGGRIASIERLITNPDHRGRGNALVLLSTMIEYALWDYDRYYNNQGAKEVRLWIFQDQEAGDWTPNYNLIRALGFNPVPKHPNWREFAQEYGFDSGGREAGWYFVNEEMYLNAKQIREDQGRPIIPCRRFDVSVFRHREKK